MLSGRKLYSGGRDTPRISTLWVDNDLYWSIEAPIATGDNVDNYIISDGQVYDKDILFPPRRKIDTIYYPYIVDTVYLRPIFPVPIEVVNDPDILENLQERIEIGQEEIGTAIKALLKARETY